MFDTVCRVFKDSVEIFYEQMGAKYLSYSYKPSDIEPVTLWAEKSLTPLYFETKQRYDKLELNFAFKNVSMGDISVFTQALLNCSVTLDNPLTVGKTFDCTLTASDFTKVARNLYTVKFSFDCLVFGEWITQTVTTSTKGITVGGAKPTEAIITFENKTGSVISLAGVNEYQITSLSAGEKLIIDGVKKLVTSGGMNVWKRVDFINFPRLNTGYNPLTIVGNAAVTIAYRERW